MDPRTAEHHAQPEPLPVYLTSSAAGGYEITLAEIWGVAVRRRWIILLSLVVTGLVAIAYLAFAQPVYRATAYLLPPRLQNVQGLLIDYGDLENYDVARYSPESVYQVFLANLKSQGARREFFDAHDLIKYYQGGSADRNGNVDRVFDTSFNRNLQVQIDRDDPSFVTVSFFDRGAEQAASWLKEIIAFTNKLTVEQLSGDVNAAIKMKISRIQQQLDSKLKLAEQRRHDKITGLREALHVARTLGISEARAFPTLVDKTALGLSINTSELPLYMRGVNALEAEIAVLESRKSDIPFISGYRDLQEQSKFLEGVTLDPSSLAAVTVDDPARVPYRAVRPNRKFVFVLAILLGIVAGIFLAVSAEIASRSRKRFMG